MTKKKVLVKSKQRKELSDISAFLRELADKIESGQVTLTQGEREILVDLPETVGFELEYYEKPKKHGLKKELEIELEWIEGGKQHKDVGLG